MKIERINDNQIKCTLSRSDLQDHELKLSELAFGTEKAKALFQDMMEEANERFGFEANDNPLMIEAIPVNPDCIILLITKMNHPDEIDERMNSYQDEESDGGDSDSYLSHDSSQTLRQAFREMEQIRRNHAVKQQAPDKTPELAIFDFGTLDDVIAVARLIDVIHLPDSALYYSRRDELYYLVIHFDEIDAAFIPSILSTLHEFGNECQNLPAIEAYFTEHCDVILREEAVEKLASI